MEQKHTTTNTGTAEAGTMEHYYTTEAGTITNVWDYLHEAEAQAAKVALPDRAADYFSIYLAAESLTAAARTLADLTGEDAAESLTATIAKAAEDIKQAAAQGQAMCIYKACM